MRKRILVGMAGGIAALAAMPVLAQPAQTGSTTITTTRSGTTQGAAGSSVTTRGQHWGSRIDGRWWAGVRAPGGWGGYRRPVPGWALPTYWIQPGYYIADYGYYGLPAPMEGQGWSRYYDDAVLTDRYGRVIDTRVGFDWDRYGGYDDALPPPAPIAPPPPPLRQAERAGSGNAVAGAVAGGVIGGVAGNVIAGKGNRVAGTVLGAGVGAVAGAAIGNNADRREREARDDYGAPYAPPVAAPPRAPDYAYGAGDYAPGYGYDRGYPAPGAGYEARWPGMDAKRAAKAQRAWEREQRRRIKTARRNGYPDYYITYPAYYGQSVPPHWAPLPAPVHGYGAGYGYESYSSGGYVAGGWYYPGETVTTITIEPATTTTTSYVTQAVTARKKAMKRVHRPKRRVVQRCGC